MFWFLDFISYILYAKYRKKQFRNELEKKAWDEENDPEARTRDALSWIISIPCGFCTNYVLIRNIDVYRDLLFEFIALFLLSVGLNVGIIFYLISKRYSNERILKIDEKYGGKISKMIIKLLFLIIGLGAFFITAMAMIVTMYAAK